MELLINHPETCSYTVADVTIHSHKSEDHFYVDVLIMPRDGTQPINITLDKEDWLEFVAKTSMALVQIEK